MPHNVRTCWNSTFIMLDFALSHQEAISRFTGNINNNLQKYKLDANDWAMVKELWGVLKVGLSLSVTLQFTMWCFTDLQACV
jgi:hypothetical protein